MNYGNEAGWGHSTHGPGLTDAKEINSIVDVTHDRAQTDCSGFTSYVYYTGAGIWIHGRTAYQISKVVRLSGEEEALPGDLVFWGDEDSSSDEWTFEGHHYDVTHVALYVGNGEIIHSSSYNLPIKWADVYGTDIPTNPTTGAHYRLGFFRHPGLPTVDQIDDVDFNRDGKHDVLRMYGPPTGDPDDPSGWDILYSHDNRDLTEDEKANHSLYTEVSPSGVMLSDGDFSFVDFDHDGDIDVLWMTGTTTAGLIGQYGWNVAENRLESYPDGKPAFGNPHLVYNSKVTSANSDILIDDINDDDFPDVLITRGAEHFDRNGWEVAYGTGNGFTEWQQIGDFTEKLTYGEMAIIQVGEDEALDFLWNRGTPGDPDWRVAYGEQGERGLHDTDPVLDGYPLGDSLSPELQEDYDLWRDANRPLPENPIVDYSFDGDDRPDHLYMTGDNTTSIEASGYSGWVISLTLPNGERGELTRAINSAVTESSGDIQFHDFTNDGLVDVLWMTGGESSIKDGWQLAVNNYTCTTPLVEGQPGYPGCASEDPPKFGGWNEVSDSKVTTSQHDVAFIDLNGDGYDDVLWTAGVDTDGYSGWYVKYNEWKTNESFTGGWVKISDATETIAGGTVLVQDVNDDQINDLARRSIDGTWTVMYGASSALSEIEDLGSTYVPGTLTSAEIVVDKERDLGEVIRGYDFTGDGEDDELWMTGELGSNDGEGWWLRAGLGDGEYTPWAWVSPSGVALGPEDVSFAFVDEDSKTDVVWLTGETSTSAEHYGMEVAFSNVDVELIGDTYQVSGNFAGGWPGFRNTGVTTDQDQLLWGDFDGDGKDDLLWTATGSDGTHSGFEVMFNQVVSQEASSTGFTGWTRVSESTATVLGDGVLVGYVDGMIDPALPSDTTSDLLWFDQTEQAWMVAQGKPGDTTAGSWDPPLEVTYPADQDRAAALYGQWADRRTERSGVVVEGEFDGDTNHSDRLLMTGDPGANDGSRLTGWMLSPGLEVDASGEMVYGPWEKVRSTGVSPLTHDVAIVDMTGDGLLDVFWTTGVKSANDPPVDGHWGWNLSVNRMTVPGFEDMGPWKPLELGGKESGTTFSSGLIAVGDFNSDGRGDVLYTEETATPNWYVSYNKISDINAPKMEYWDTITSDGFVDLNDLIDGTAYPKMVITDVNGDTTDDIAWTTDGTNWSARYGSKGLAIGAEEVAVGDVAIKLEQQLVATRTALIGDLTKQVQYDINGDGILDMLVMTGRAGRNTSEMIAGWNVALGNGMVGDDAQAVYGPLLFAKASQINPYPEVALKPEDQREPSSVIIRDFTNDGLVDVLWMAGDDEEEIVPGRAHRGWYLSENRSGSTVVDFGPWVKVSDSQVRASGVEGGVDLVPGDFDGDGYNDMLWIAGAYESSSGNEYSGWYIKYNEWSSSGEDFAFTSGWPEALSEETLDFFEDPEGLDVNFAELTLSNSSAAIEIGDIDSDGADDISWTMTIDSEPERVTVYGQPTPIAKDLALDSSYAPGISTSAEIVVGKTRDLGEVVQGYDFTGDGEDDELWMSDQLGTGTDEGWWLRAGLGDGTFTTWARVSSSGVALGPEDVSFALVDGDVKTDVVWLTDTTSTSESHYGMEVAFSDVSVDASGEVPVVTGSFSGGWPRFRNTGVTTEGEELVWGDFNGDGKDDLLWMTGVASGTHYGWEVMFNQVSSRTSTTTGFSGWTRVSGLTEKVRADEAAGGVLAGYVDETDPSAPGATSDLLWFDDTTGWMVVYGVAGSTGPWGAPVLAPDQDQAAALYAEWVDKRAARSGVVVEGEFDGQAYVGRTNTPDRLLMTGDPGADNGSRLTGWMLSSGSVDAATGEVIYGPWVKVRSTGVSPLTHDAAVLDMNGDGLLDVFWTTGVKDPVKVDSHSGWQLAVNRIDTDDNFGPWAAVEVGGKESSKTFSSGLITVGDFNGDDVNDVLYSDTAHTNWDVAYNKTAIDASTATMAYWTTIDDDATAHLDTLIDGTTNPAMIITDVNSDFIDDIVWTTDSGTTWYVRYGADASVDPFLWWGIDGVRQARTDTPE
ncbi:MAG: FG-GAP repeat protein [Demequinaceae bacterium]|nr:FG-GAP repeat protein [Demequinaceae bacterium]